MHHITPADFGEVANSVGGIGRVVASCAVPSPTIQSQRRKVREPWPKQTRREVQNLREVAVYVRIGLEGVDILFLRDIGAFVQGDLYMRARFGPVCTIAVVNVGPIITFLEPDRGSGDTDGCDGEEGCEELSGEHLCWQRSRQESGERVRPLRDSVPTLDPFICISSICRRLRSSED